MVSTKKTISVTSDRELRETYTCILATMERMLFGRTSNSERSRYRYRAVCCRSVPAPHHNTNSGRWGAVDRRNCRLRRAVAVGKCPRRAVSCVCCVPAAPTTNRVDLMDLWIRVNGSSVMCFRTRLLTESNNCRLFEALCCWLFVLPINQTNESCQMSS